MSIANGTTHYNYPQVQLRDRPTFADFNPAFADIDTKLYGLITGASTDHSAIEALQTGLGETNLLLATVKDTADNAKSKADTNAENITLLQTALGNTDRAVANKLDSVAIAEPYDATAGTYAVGDIVVYNGQRYKCTTAVAVAEPFDADKWTGEDVETVLERLATPDANDVTLAPITGMEATNAQDGIAELKSNLTQKEITVTCDGVKTYSQLFTELHALIRAANARLTDSVIDLVGNVYSNCSSDIEHASFVQCLNDSSTQNITTVVLQTAISFARATTTTGGTTFTNLAANVPTSGNTITFKYFD